MTEPEATLLVLFSMGLGLVALGISVAAWRRSGLAKFFGGAAFAVGALVLLLAWAVASNATLD